MSFLWKISDLYQAMWKAIIRPPRDYYTISELGPQCFVFAGRPFRRRDFELINSRGNALKCSHFEPVKNIEGTYLTSTYPCVVYLHGNCSSRLEALNCGCLKALLPFGISVFCFDFAGCGLSDGEYISLGWHEKDDLRKVIEHLRDLKRISTIGLWGRSMGAVTACMFADSDPSIAALILDSPFSSLRKLAEELASDFIGWKLPKVLLSPALHMVRNTIISQAKFDLDSLQLVNHCKHSFTPALFVAAKDDTFIRPQHCRELYNVYAGDKNIIIVEGNHNSSRPSFLHDSIAIFFRCALQLPEISPLNYSDSILWENLANTLAMDTNDSQMNEFFPRNSRTKSSCKTRRLNALDNAQERNHSPEEKDTVFDSALGQSLIFESIQKNISESSKKNLATSPDDKSYSNSPNARYSQNLSSPDNFLNPPTPSSSSNFIHIPCPPHRLHSKTNILK